MAVNGVVEKLGEKCLENQKVQSSLFERNIRQIVNVTSKT